MPRPRILFIAGSTRQGSLNARLVNRAAELAEQTDAMTVTRIDLSDYDLPIYNGDLEAQSGLPENARKLKALFRSHHGFLFASPEYNSTISPLLLNALHWVSRAEHGDEPPLAAFRGKVAALTAASPGGFGGLRGLVPLRMMLGNIGVHVLPDQLAVAQAHQAFDDDGSLQNPHQEKILGGIVQELGRIAREIGTAEG